MRTGRGEACSGGERGRVEQEARGARRARQRREEGVRAGPCDRGGRERRKERGKEKKKRKKENGREKKKRRGEREGKEEREIRAENTALGRPRAVPDTRERDARVKEE